MKIFLYPFKLILWVLYFILWIPIKAINSTFRFTFTLIINAFYERKFKNMSDVDIQSEKQDFYDNIKDINDPYLATLKLKEYIPEYKSDWVFGALNWSAKWWVTLLRQKYLKDKHGYDCADHSELLKAIIEHSKLGDEYEKLEIKSYFSLWKPIYNSHTVLIGYRKNGWIDIYTPYNFWGIVENNLINRFKIYESIEKYFNQNRPFRDCVKYLPYSV